MTDNRTSGITGTAGYVIGRELVDAGVFIGAAPLPNGIRVHAVRGSLARARDHVFPEIHGYYSVVAACGLNMDPGITIFRDGVLRFNEDVLRELPAIITCQNCVAAIATRLDTWKEEAARLELEGPAAELPSEIAVLPADRDELLALQEQVRQLTDERDEFRHSLEDGVREWREKRGAMGGKIHQLEGEVRQLRLQLEHAKTTNALPKARRELTLRLEKAQQLAAAWQGLAGILLWQLGGAGTSEKEIRLDPLAYAAAVGRVVGVTMSPQQDGSVVVRATLTMPPAPEQED